MTSRSTLDIPHADAIVLDDAAWHPLAGRHASVATSYAAMPKTPRDHRRQGLLT